MSIESIGMRCSTRGYKRQREFSSSTILPQDVLKEIFGNLNLQEFGTLASVSREWNYLSNDPVLLKAVVYRNVAFSPLHWNGCFGNNTVKEEEIEKAFQLLPANIGSILKSPCKAFKKKRIAESNILAWIPEAINDQLLTINSYGELLKQRPEFPGYQLVMDSIIVQEGDKRIEPGWVLMTMAVLSKSENKTYESQDGVIQSLNKRSQITYRVPKLGEAIISIYAMYFKTGENRFSRPGSYSYARCQEIVNGRETDFGGPFDIGYSAFYYGVAPLCRLKA